MKRFRCWLENQPEPTDYAIEAADAVSAAAWFVDQGEDKDADELAKHPALVFVRPDSPVEEHEMPVQRIRVTASIEVTVWAYPEDAA